MDSLESDALLQRVLDNVAKHGKYGEATDALHQCWLRAYGPPERLSVDAGPEFQGRFEQMCKIAGIVMGVVPPNAKWRAGLAERHGSIAKLMLLRFDETVILS